MKTPHIDSGYDRVRPDGATERIVNFANGRRARVLPNGDAAYDVQLLDCRNDEHENRLFPQQIGLTLAAAEKALATISKLPRPTPHKWDR